MSVRSTLRVLAGLPRARRIAVERGEVRRVWPDALADAAGIVFWRCLHALLVLIPNRYPDPHADCPLCSEAGPARLPGFAHVARDPRIMYLLRGTNEDGQPVELPIEVCWRCGVPVVVSLVSMFEHVDRMHPLPPPAKHAAREDPPHPTP